MNKRRLNNDENTCDKCGAVLNTFDLIWITSEDFTPYEKEVVKETAFKKYDALCEECYQEELE